LEDDSSEDDAAEQTDDEDAAEASKLAAADGDDEFRLLLESAVTEVTGASSGGVAVEPLPSAAAAAAAAPTELLQVLNVTEILKRNHVSHAEAKLVKQVVTVLEDMLHATNPVPGVRCFEMKSGNGSSITWMRVPRGRVPDGDAGLKQQQRRAKIVACVMETTGAGVETLTRIIRTQRAIFTEAASRASIVSKQHLGVEATLQVTQSVNASWSGMRALKKLLGHFGIHLKLASEVAVKVHVNEFTVPLTYFRVHLDAGKAAKGVRTEALVSCCCIFDVLARDADAIMAGKLGTFKERTFPNDPNVHGRRTMHVVRKRMLCFGWEWAQTAGPATAIATRRTLSLCSFLEKGKRKIDTPRTPKSCALKPKSKWRKWRPRSRRCVGQSRLSRQRKSKASRKMA